MNFIDFIFISFTLVILFLAVLINWIEPYLPIFITQTFRYGKHSYKGAPNKIAQLSEIPKSYFKHFYVFALVWSISVMYLVTWTYLGGYPIPAFVINGLDIVCGRSRKVKSTAATTFIAVFLIMLQCIRRFYETHFVQVFSSTSKMNLSHYIVGYFHYFGAFLAVISQAQGFVRGSLSESIKWNDITLLHCVAVGLFLYAWYNQFMSNLILASLRKNHSGEVITQKHLLPTGGYFESVSSPHMYFEVVIYVALYIILYNNSSWLFVMCWVISNQAENAWLTHQWYIETFPDYPKSRKAIFPNIL
ncbi:Polyprenol reductase [Pseudolycoriella hygida]|uniref:Polyprenal reductase n=1 Tax=Pseudolycoriella hygida TaxID=35572 RepID=A0A9Q0S783_9DIPT|nr:Polyprenol reductase [Pseudolycoriella hygida]